jgi:hypothetical protein
VAIGRCNDGQNNSLKAEAIMLHWPEFRSTAPEIATIGEKLLYNPKAGEVAIIATVDHQQKPWVAPFCPIFTEQGMYLLAGAHTPKARHLLVNSAYSLHALLGADDLEFQVAGMARSVTMERERSAVISAVPFPSFDATDPIFELQIARALTVTWPEPGINKRQTWTAP